MKKTKNIVLIFILLALMLIIPNVSNAADEITVSRDIYSMDGSMKFTFAGLTIDTTHEYEYGLTKTAATAVEDWYLVTENTETSVTANIMIGTEVMREVINAVDTGYITIKDKTTDTVILEPYAVDLKLPFLKVTNYEVISNGQNLDNDYNINVALRNAKNSQAYYKYEKITDQNLINKYKEIKVNSGDYTALESLLKTSAPTSGYSTWGYWNGHDSDGRNGYGYTTRTVTAPDEGLYYLWVYFSGENIKNLYGCILVDNLQPDIAVDSISLPATKTVELGKTITLQPTFNPSTATNKIVTWTSSDETVAIVNNAGKITPIKVGSTIITVITQDGNKKATCTVTVTDPASDDSGSGDTNTENNNNNDNNNDNNNNPIQDVNIPDFSKAQFNFSYGTYKSLSLEIANIDIAQDDQYYIYISKSQDEQPTSDTKGASRISVNEEGKIETYFGSEASSNILEVKGKNYIYIIRKDIEGNSQILLKAKEMEELSLPPLGQRLDIWLYDEEKTGVSNKININSERKITYKMGKIDSKDVLRSFKNDSSNQAYNNLLKYAKSAKYLTTGTITVDGLDYNIAKDVTLEEDAYYFVYMIVETKDGKYNELEDVAIYEENKMNDKNALVHFAFNTIKVDDEVPDNTVVQTPVIPNAGKSVLIVIVAVFTIIGGYIAYKKYKYLNFR